MTECGNAPTPQICILCVGRPGDWWPCPPSLACLVTIPSLSRNGGGEADGEAGGCKPMFYFGVFLKEVIMPSWERR